MTKKVFKGVINGVEYTDAEEFNKVLKNYKPEGLKQVSSSYEIVETSDEEKPKVQGVQRVLDKTYNPFEVLDNVFSTIFDSFKTVQTPVAPKKEEKPFDPTTFKLKCNLDKISTDSDANDKMLDEYDQFIQAKLDCFEKLSDNQKEQVRKMLSESYDDVNEKMKSTQAVIDKLNDKLLVMIDSLNALELQKGYYDEVLDVE